MRHVLVRLGVCGHTLSHLGSDTRHLREYGCGGLHRVLLGILGIAVLQDHDKNICIFRVALLCAYAKGGPYDDGSGILYSRRARPPKLVELRVLPGKLTWSLKKL